MAYADARRVVATSMSRWFPERAELRQPPISQSSTWVIRPEFKDRTTYRYLAERKGIRRRFIVVPDNGPHSLVYFIRELLRFEVEHGFQFADDAYVHLLEEAIKHWKTWRDETMDPRPLKARDWFLRLYPKLVAPDTLTYVKKSEAADRLEIYKSNITRWEKAGRIKTNDDGEVCLEDCRRLARALRDRDKLKDLDRQIRQS